MRSRDELRPAQVSLVKEMKEFPSGIAVLGMGGGKTCSALTVAADLMEAKKIRRAIVLAPARVVDNVWPNETAKWDYLDDVNCKVQAIVGTPKKRERLMETAGIDVYVVSIDNTQWLIDFLVRKKWNLSDIQLFIDEISRFRNPRSVRAKALFKIADQFAGIWGLTGTPRPNGYEDLWMPIRLVSGDAKVWGEFQKVQKGGMKFKTSDFDTWRDRHFYKLDHAGHQWEPHRFCIPTLDAVANEWMVHGSVADLGLKALNTGDDFVRWTQMSPEQEGRYEQMMEDLVTIGREKGLGGEQLITWIVEACSQGVASGKLSQIAQGFLYLKEEDKEPYRIKDNPKLAELAEMDEDLGGDRAIICYGFREEIAMIEELMLKQRRTTALIGGGVSTKRANDAIAAWNKGEIDRLLIHPASAGHGIELQFGGHHMVWFHPTWSPELFDQTIKRIHRPGQEFECFNWQIAMRGTNDEIKLARVLNKREDEDLFKANLRRLL